jgi:hypothetical protein
MLVLAAAFAAFAVYLCLSLTDITPFFLAVTFAVSVLAVVSAAACAFSSIKRCTQKNE